MRVLGLPPDIGDPTKPLEKVGQKEPIGPCGQYRIKYPFEALNDIEGVHAEYGAYPLEYIWEYARDFDMIVIHRQTMPHMRSFVDHCQTFLGKKVIVDVDDAVLDLDHRNPAYVWWGEDKDLVWQMFCQLREQDKSDPRLASVKPEQIFRVVDENRGGFEWMLRRADMVTVTTDFLQDEYEEYNDNVVVLPNCIKREDWVGIEPKRMPEAEGKVVVGWSGGDSHAPDLALVKTAVARALRRFENVIFMIVGFPDAVKMFPDDVRDRILTIPWSGIDEYRGWLAGFDIGLAPAQPNKTNKGKSGIRIYELALARDDGVAVVASPHPYKSDVHKGMGTVAANAQKFEKAMVRYIQDEKLRREHGTALREHVLREHSVVTNVDMWFDAYHSLMN